MKVSDMDELVFLWKEYGKVHDERLTKDAQDLKQQVLGFVQSLPTFHEKAKHMKEAPEKRLECFGFLFQ